ncbi:hypothetical protein P154DRAFT_588888 [Amniculicola lignicola CBS 123094]|uniref:Uncharacterized protein n=1 Tax=Amniculicola lignicola CBS 123094 TaxID=1392246 RepID=A0A6A5WYJ6_9PLEO|nr:hypothetical protein P154DRAFT_588888 [Amniculicola lignicola CBS 123094]
MLASLFPRITSSGPFIGFPPFPVVFGSVVYTHFFPSVFQYWKTSHGKEQCDRRLYISPIFCSRAKLCDPSGVTTPEILKSGKMLAIAGSVAATNNALIGLPCGKSRRRVTGDIAIPPK